MHQVKTSLIGGLSVIALVAATSGVVAQDSTGAANVEPFTSSYTFIDQPDIGTDEALLGKVRTTGQAWHFRSTESSDPRLEGELTFTLTQDAYPEVTVFVRAARLANEEGAWQAEPTWVIDEDLVPGLTLDQVYTGEGDYEGQILVADWTWTDGGFGLDGHIIESDLPTLPAPWSAE
jgi:hypothetical protein